VAFRISDFRFQVGAAALVACLGGVARAEVIDRVLAVVAGELILQSDVAAARELQLVTIEPGAGDPARQVLSQLIDRALVLAVVERFAPPEPDAAEVDAALARLRARFPSPAAYADTLTRVGLEERHLRETLRQDLRMAAYLAQRFTSPPATDAELDRYYREHIATYTRDGVVQPFEAVRPEVTAALGNQRRAGMVGDWLAGLRRRADIRDLSAPLSVR
jgi:hypothetical protein